MTTFMSETFCDTSLRFSKCSAFVLRVCFYSTDICESIQSSHFTFFPLLFMINLYFNTSMEWNGFPATQLQFITLCVREIRLWLRTAHFATIVQKPITLEAWGSHVASTIKTAHMKHTSVLSKLTPLVMPLFKPVTTNWPSTILITRNTSAFYAYLDELHWYLMKLTRVYENISCLLCFTPVTYKYQTGKSSSIRHVLYIHPIISLTVSMV
jgi:hypothetical protein